MIKTPCCKADYHKLGRANYRCVKCDADVTIHLVLISMIEENNADKKDKKAKGKRINNPRPT
jgi:hypothetical protein